MITYKNIIIDILENVYSPLEDSFLLADNLNFTGARKVLDLGTGSGLQAILAAKAGCEVVATDINPEAVECARKNAELNKVSEKISFRTGNLFTKLENEKFDLIIFNPPYLPKEEKYADRLIDLSYNSSEVLERFLKEYKNYLNKNGRTVIVNSSLSGVFVHGKTIAEKKFDFEKISVVELS